MTFIAFLDPFPIVIVKPAYLAILVTSHCRRHLSIAPFRRRRFFVPQKEEIDNNLTNFSFEDLFWRPLVKLFRCLTIERRRLPVLPTTQQLQCCQMLSRSHSYNAATPTAASSALLLILTLAGSGIAFGQNNVGMCSGLNGYRRWLPTAANYFPNNGLLENGTWNSISLECLLIFVPIFPER